MARRRPLAPRPPLAALALTLSLCAPSWAGDALPPDLSSPEKAVVAFVEAAVRGDTTRVRAAASPLFLWALQEGGVSLEQYTKGWKGWSLGEIQPARSRGLDLASVYYWVRGGEWNPPVLLRAELSRGDDGWHWDGDGTYRPIRGRVRFAVEEEHAGVDTPPVPVLRLALHEQAGSALNCGFAFENGTITVHLATVHNAACVTQGMSPPAASFRLDLPPGSYGLVFSGQDSSAQYTLSISPSTIRVEGPRSDAVAPSVDLYYRYPPKSFAYPCGVTPDRLARCEELASFLLSEGPFTEYRYPVPERGAIAYAPWFGRLELPERAYFCFTYESEEDFDTAGELLRTFAARGGKGGPEVDFLQNWRNRVLYLDSR